MEMEDHHYNYWFEWQVPVCGVFIVVPAAVALRHLRTSLPGNLRSFDLWSCCWRNVSPVWVLLYRAIAFLVLALILFYFVALMGPFAFYFYTQWTFALVMAYFGLATVISAHGCWMMMSSSENQPELKEKINNLNSPNHTHRHKAKASSWGHLMLALYHTSAGACMLTDLVFWCLLVPLQANVDFELTFLIGSLHTVNAIFLIGDTMLNGLPFSWFGFANFVLWSCLYITFQWVVHACGFMTWWPYPFLELNTPWAPLWYFGMALFHIPCYWIYAMLFKAKNSLCPRLFPRAFVRLN